MLKMRVMYNGANLADAALLPQHLEKQLRDNMDVIPVAAKSAMEVWLEKIISDVKNKHSAPWKAGQVNPNLYRRSGRGIKSLRYSVRKDNRKLSAVGSIYLNEYMYMHTSNKSYMDIKPVKSKYLAIPLPEALDSRGVPKKLSPLQWKHTHVMSRKKGGYIIYQNISKNKKKLLYVLLPAVKVRPRIKMQGTIGFNQQYFIETFRNELRSYFE